jgi:hypothetical protein
VLAILKEKLIPSGQRTIDAVELWEVRWLSTCNISSGGFAYTKEHVEAFPTEQAANDFRQALYAAYALLKSPSDRVSMQKVTP